MPTPHSPVRSRPATQLRRRAARVAATLLVATATTAIATSSASAAPAPLPSTDLGVVARPSLAPWSNLDLYWFQDSAVDPATGDLLLTVDGAVRGGNLMRVPRGASEPSGAIALELRYPGAIGIAPDGTTYVTHNAGSSSAVSVIEPGETYSDAHRPRTIPVDAGPIAIAVAANGTAYVANHGSNTVSVISPGVSYTASEPPTIAVGSRPSGIAIAPDGRILVTNEGEGTVSVIEPNAPLNATPSRITVGAGPSSIAVDRPRKVAYVTNDGDHTLSRIDLTPSVGRASNAARTARVALRAQTPVPSVPVQSQPTDSDPRTKNDHLSDVSVAADGTVYVSFERGDAPGSLLVVDPAVAYDRSDLPREIAVGDLPFSLAIDARENTGTIYVPNAGNGTVSVIDQATIAFDTNGDLDAHVTRRDGLPTGGDVVFTTATSAPDKPLAVVPVDATGHAVAPAGSLAAGTEVTATYRPRGDKGASLLAATGAYVPTPGPVAVPPILVPQPNPDPPRKPVPAPAPAPSPVERANLGSSQVRRIETVLAGRAAIRVRCPERCQLRGNLMVSRATAKRLGLRSRIIGTVRGDGQGWVEARVRLRPSAVRSLRRSPRSLKATIRVGGAGKGQTVGFRIKADPKPPRRS